MSPFREVKGGVRIAVRVQPRAAKSECAGLHGSELRIRLTAPPVDGAANEALIRFLADTLGVPARRVTITAGLTSRSKSVLVEGVSAAAAAARLEVG
jgi:uncharacterized protein (TIGR00251 family)